MVNKERTDIMYLIDGAKRVSVFPFFRVDPGIRRCGHDLDASCRPAAKSATSSRMRMNE